MHPVKFYYALALTLAAAILTPTASVRAQVVSVSSSAGFQQALNDIPEGGIVELAAGTYNAPSGGFTIYAPKGFTVRAAAGAAVTISGGGVSDIVRLANGTVGSGRAVRFEDLNFKDGRTTQNFIGGAFTIVNTEAIFVRCDFSNNAANPDTTGGGALWIQNSYVTLQGCSLRSNRSKNYGGAISALDARLFITGTRFLDNRVDLPGHIPNSPGGALFINSCFVRISGSAFEDNHAGYTGGAIYALGGWKEPLSTPSVDLVVSDSSFLRNSATRDPGVQFSAPSVGGAVHLEDQTTGRFVNCRFISNIARQGGAISTYRAILEINGCVFKANQSTGSGNGEAIGGTIVALSFDGLDETTQGGTINRRSASVVVEDTYFEGGTGADARQGGCIFASGDLNSAYGFSGVTPDKSAPPEANRGILTLKRVVFSDFRAGGAGGVPGTGGAVMGDFLDFKADNILVERCIATDFGGGLEFIQGSTALVENSTIAESTAGSLGGGITMFGGRLDVTNTQFLRNRISGTGNGAAITTAPDTSSGARPPVDMTGLISNCLFVNNTGGATIYDGDRTSSPVNRLQYSSNQFFPNANAFLSDNTGMMTAEGLNDVTVVRQDGSSTKKAPVANVILSAVPNAGKLLMVPAGISQSGAPGESLPIPSYLGYAWVGQQATLDGTALQSSSGTMATTNEGPHVLQVGNFRQETVPPAGAALNISTRLPVGTGTNVLIGGFIIQGPTSKRVIVRAIGPSLTASGVEGALQDPALDLYDSGGSIIASNDNWQNTQVGGAIVTHQATEIFGSTVPPSANAEAAIVVELNPGAYTAVVRGAGSSTGVALVEVYDLSSGAASKLANISTRGFVQTGTNVMIGGFIYGGGPAATNIVIRALGPSLAGAGVTNFLADPTLELFDGNGNSVAANDNWKDTQQAAITATGLQPANDSEATLLMTSLTRGPYTAIVRGKDGGTGVGIVEAYVFQ